MRVLTPKQLDEWAAYDQLEPVGSYATDIILGQISATIADAVSAFGGEKDRKPSDPRSWIWYMRNEIIEEEKRAKGKADIVWMQSMFGGG